MASNSMPARLVGVNGKTFETYVSKPAPATIRKHARLWEARDGWGGGELEIVQGSPVIHFKLVKVTPAASKYENDYATYAQISADEAEAIRKAAVAAGEAILSQQQYVAKLLAPQKPAKPSQPYNAWDPLNIADKPLAQITSDGANVAMDQYAPWTASTNAPVPIQSAAKPVVAAPAKPVEAPKPTIPEPLAPRRRMMLGPKS